MCQHKNNVNSYTGNNIPVKSHHFGHPLSSFTKPFVSRNRKSNHFTNQNLALSANCSLLPLRFRPGKNGATRIHRNPASNSKLSLQVLY